MRVQTAGELWRILTDIFPSFASACSSEELESNTTLHAVMLDFTPYFTSHRDQFSEKQIKQLAAFLNEAIVLNDTLENAVQTCFMEHLWQLKAYKVLAPHLSKQAKAKTRA